MEDRVECDVLKANLTKERRNKMAIWNDVDVVLPREYIEVLVHSLAGFDLAEWTGQRWVTIRGDVELDPVYYWQDLPDKPQ